jgi:hypothetical protein
VVKSFSRRRESREIGQVAWIPVFTGMTVEGWLKLMVSSFLLLRHSESMAARAKELCWFIEQFVLHYRGIP